MQRIQQDLSPVVEPWYSRPIDFVSDPLTSFYKVPLTRASAAAGTAENFQQPVMRAVRDRQNHFKQPEAITPPVDIVAVVPDSLNDPDNFQADVMRRLNRTFPNRLKFPKLVVSPNGREVRSVKYIQ